MATAEFKIAIPATGLVRVLLVDDEPAMIRSLTRRLKSMACEVDAASTLAEASDLLQKNQYQLIVVDQIYGLEELRGDEFLIQNESLMGDSKRVIITGNALDTIRHQEELKRKGILILEKGERSFLETIKNIIHQLFQQQQDLVSSRIEAAIPRILKGTPHLESHTADTTKGAEFVVLEKVKELLIGYLLRLGQSDKTALLYRGKELSPRMLVDEIERGTDIGLEHMDMFLDLIKNNLGL